MGAPGIDGPASVPSSARNGVNSCRAQSEGGLNVALRAFPISRGLRCGLKIMNLYVEPPSL